MTGGPGLDVPLFEAGSPSAAVVSARSISPILPDSGLLLARRPHRPSGARRDPSDSVDGRAGRSDMAAIAISGIRRAPSARSLLCRLVWPWGEG